MLKKIIFLTFAASSAVCIASESGCKSSAKFFKTLADWRNTGVPIAESRRRVAEVMKDSPKHEQKLWIAQVENVYLGKLKGFTPVQAELMIYNLCMDRLALP